MGTNVKTNFIVKDNVLTTVKNAVIFVWRSVLPYADIFYFLFLAFLIWCKSTYVEKTDYLNTFFTLSAVCVAIKYVFTRWNIRDILISAALIVFGYITYKNSGHSILLVTAAGIVGAKDVNLKRMLCMCCVLRIALYIYVVAFANMGVITLGKATQWATENGVQVVKKHYDMGFTRSNSAHIIFFVTAALYIAANYKKYNVIHAAVMVFLNFALYELTNCRTGFIMVFIVVALALIFKFKPVYKAVGKIAPFVGCIVAAFGIALTYMYGQYDFVTSLDLKLSSRIYLARFYMDEYGLTWFGQDAALSYPWRALDAAWANCVVNYGVIAFALVMLCDIFLVYRSVKKGDRGLTVAFIAMAIMAMVENYTMDIGVNFTLMFAAELIFVKRGGILLSGADNYKENACRW